MAAPNELEVVADMAVGVGGEQRRGKVRWCDRRRASGASEEEIALAAAGEGCVAEQVRTVGAFPAEVLSALYASSDLFSDYTR